MPSAKREKTKYPGVYFITSKTSAGTPERIYYIQYRKQGKLIEEKAGKQYQDDMTPARASQQRLQKINGDRPSNREDREKKRIEKERIGNRYTINRLWEAYRESHLDLKGLKTDEYRYNLHLKALFGEKEPFEISPLELDRVRIELSKTRKSQTVKHVLIQLRRIVNYGVKKQLCTGLTFQIEVPRVDNVKTEDLTPEQIQKLLHVLDEEPDIQTADMVRMALFTGMRRGELFRLKWEDIDFKRGFISICGPKGGKDEIIPLNDRARGVLENHPRSDSPYIFPGKYGEQRRWCKKPIARIKKNAGLPADFRPFHGLRHVFASMLASSGEVDLYTLSKLLTHKSPLMTQRYAHLRDEVLRKASNKASSIIDDITRKE